VTWRLASRTAGQGWFLCGDAASVLDPSSSHGVLRALMSGMLAAHYATGVLKGAAEAGEVAAVYDRWMRQWFSHDATRMAGTYREAGLFGY
jgi:flavin-dependent dehydrogenase